MQARTDLDLVWGQSGGVPATPRIPNRDPENVGRFTR